MVIGERVRIVADANNEEVITFTTIEQAVVCHVWRYREPQAVYHLDLDAVDRMLTGLREMSGPNVLVANAQNEGQLACGYEGGACWLKSVIVDIEDPNRWDIIATPLGLSEKTPLMDLLVGFRTIAIASLSSSLESPRFGLDGATETK